MRAPKMPPRKVTKRQKEINPFFFFFLILLSEQVSWIGFMSEQDNGGVIDRKYSVYVALEISDTIRICDLVVNNSIDDIEENTDDLNLVLYTDLAN